MKTKNMCIITDGYPSDKRIVNTFVEQLINKFADFDINCYVIAPQSLTRIWFKGFPKNPKEYYRVNENGKSIKVYSPYYFTFSNKKTIINTNKINLYSFEKSVKKIFYKLSKTIKFDVIYAHFIFPSAIVANKLSKRNNIPVYFAYGENTSYTIDYLGIEKTKKLLDGINGVISVSTENKKRLIDNNIIPEKLIRVFPNAINNNIFYKKDKMKAREKLGFAKNDFILAFVGRFVNVKGIDRLCDTLNLINNKNIKAIFIGEGNIKPNYKNTIFEGTIQHNEIADYLSASDIFVLPTTAEGCCNAIIEALACGIPVISSKESFNDDILDDSCSIRINTMNVLEIKEAIERLYNDIKLREKLSEGALYMAKKFEIQNRAKGIIEFIEGTMNNNIQEE
ncbi:MAG: glycosyltransferase family 4 protein [Clostridia bacterium]|nr:glycosyltransferase family 4 protein [Clostridia bacterium]